MLSPEQIEYFKTQTEFVKAMKKMFTQMHKDQEFEDPCIFYTVDKFSKLKIEDPFFDILGIEKKKEDPRINEYYDTTTKKL